MLVVAMITPPSEDNNKDMYFFTQPLFNNMEECMLYTRNYAPLWMSKVFEAYPDGKIETVYCIDIDKFKKAIEEEQRKQEGLNT